MSLETQQLREAREERSEDLWMEALMKQSTSRQNMMIMAKWLMGWSKNGFKATATNKKAAIMSGRNVQVQCIVPTVKSISVLQ